MSKPDYAPTEQLTPEEILEVVPRGGPLVIDARTFICPHCERPHDVLRYLPLDYAPKYAEQIVVPLRCPSCGHIFALRPVPEYEEARDADQG